MSRQTHGCSKRRLPTELDAKIALASTFAHGRPGRRHEVRYYRCGRCRGFHLTSRAPA